MLGTLLVGSFLFFTFILTNVSFFQLVCLTPAPLVYSNIEYYPQGWEMGELDRWVVWSESMNLIVQEWNGLSTGLSLETIGVQGDKVVVENLNDSYSSYYTILFDAYSHTNNVLFYPLQNKLYCVSGELVLAFFRLDNSQPHSFNGLAIYSIYPPQNAVYFIKMQCFCYEQLHLSSFQKADLPVLFYISPLVESNSELNSTFYLQYNLLNL
jgi:hypothetical protein